MSKTPEEWKIKYFDSLSELEQKERQWQSVESLLRRCISRLSFIGDGIDHQLDRRLEQLRNRVRGEQDIKALLQAIEDITGNAEKAGESRIPDAAISAEELMIQLVSEADLPKTLKKRVHKLTKALNAPRMEPAVLQSAKTLLLDAISATTKVGREEKSGLLSKLFVKDRPAAEKPVATELASGDITHRDQIEGKKLFLFLVNRLNQSHSAGTSFSSLATRADAVTNNRELEGLAIELTALLSGPGEAARPGTLPPADQVLLQLLELLDATPELQPRIHSLKSRLSSGITQPDIIPILRELLQLVEHARIQAEQERQEVEKFLLQMTEQLQKLDQEVNSIGNTGQALIEGGRRIGSEVQQQVTGLQDTVDQSGDLNGLKQSITGRLNLIQERLRGHRDETEQLVQDFKRRMDRLNTRIEDMERERVGLYESVEKARSEAFTDALTGLQNRQAFDCRLHEEYLRWTRYNNPLSMIIVDVDHFKQVNDTYGHLAGDKVLSVIGAHLKHATRQVDFSARYGGEEFVILLPEADLDGAKSVAEKIRQAVEEKPFHAGENRVKITVSCGVASYREGDGRKTPFERADEALYLAKRSGRNRCCGEDQIKRQVTAV